MQNYNLPDACTGNTFYGVKFILPPDAVYSLQGAKIKMALKAARGSEPAAVFSSEGEDAKLNIIDNRSFEIIKHDVDLKENVYKYDILFEFADGRKSTLIGGQWTINPVITE